MKHAFFLFLVLLLSGVSFAQRVSVSGIIKDSTDASLPSATVLLLAAKDSSLVNFASSNHEGFFEMRSIPRQLYILKISYIGYYTYSKLLDLMDDSPSVNVGKIILAARTDQLDEITIIAEKPPVVIKQDTIEFNAESFKTKENAVVEDLLKKLPGVEVDNDGTIRAQGQQVRRVTVDGKNFFGNDPKIATRNLPADAISKVQVYDRKSDQATFTGIDDGQREKTINLELKDEKRKGAFGTLMAGAGNDERFQSRASINKFQKTNHLSLLAMANNVNEQGFGIDDYMNFTGGAQQMMAGRGGAVRVEIGTDNQSGVPLNFGNRMTGLMTSYAAGLNMNRQLSKNTEANSSYFYNRLDQRTETDLERVNYLPGGAENRYNQNSSQRNANDNHRFNAQLDHKVDSMNSLRLTTNFTYNRTEMNEVSNNRLFTSEGDEINTGERATSNNGATSGLNSNLLWRHRFNKKGRTLSSSLLFNYSVSDRDGTQNARLTQGGENSSVEIVQTNKQEVSTRSYGATVSYTEPLGGRKYLEVNYSFRENTNAVSRFVYDISGDDPELNETLSTAYNSIYQYHRGGVNFRVNRSKYNFTAGGSLQQTFLKGKLELPDQIISRSFQNVLPVLRFNYQFTNMKRINVDYETNVQEPGIQQLQPVVDNTDPMNLYVGNPDLKPAYTQSVHLNYTVFHPGTFVSFFGFVQAALTDNYITVSQTFMEHGIRLSRPVNVSDMKSVMGNASLGFPINKLKSRFNISANVNHQSGATVINEIQSNTAQNTISGRLRYDFRYKEALDVGFATSVSRQSVNYVGQQADQLFFNNVHNADLTLRFLKKYSLNGSLEYLTYENKTSDYSQTLPLVNLSLSRFLLKAKAGELKVGVHNLLNRSLGYSQTATLTYFERQQVNNLGRYVMVSFTYALNKQLNPMGARPQGGMIRMMR
jgi:hypothetical protein